MSWEIFERRMEDSTVTAIRLANELVQFKHPHGLERLNTEIPRMDNVTMRQLARQLKIAELLSSETGPHDPDPDLIVRLRQRVEKELARQDEGDLFADSPSPEKLEAYTSLMDNVYNVTQAFSPARASANFDTLENLLPEIEELLSTPPTDYLENDITELRIDARENMADCLVSLGKNEEAQQHYEDAILEAETIGLSSKAMTCHRKLTEVLYARVGEFDNALSGLLQEWQKARHEKAASIHRALVGLMLGEAYAKIGDFFEAEKMFRHVERDLGEMGFPRPTPRNADGRVGFWIRAADRATKGPVDFQWLLLKVVTAFLSIAHKRSEISRDPAKRESALALFHALTDVATQINDRWRKISDRDKDHLAGLAPPADGDSGMENGRDTPFLENSKQIGDLMLSLHRRIENGEVSREILDEVSGLEARSRQLGFADYAVATLDQKAGLLLALGDSREAVETWRQAVDESVDRGRLGYALYLLERMTAPCFDPPDHGALSEICEEAIALIESTRLKLSPVYQQSEFLQRKILFYQLGVMSAFKLAEHETMLRRMELSKARGTLRSLMTHREETDFPGADALDKRIREIHSELKEADDQSSVFLKQERRLLMDLLSIRRAEASGKKIAEPFELKSAQAALKPDEAVVYYYWLDPQVVLVVGLDSGQLVVDRQILEDETRLQLVQFTEDFGEMNELDQETLNSFASVLLPEPVHSVLRDKKRILFSPNRFLHLFPFHVLEWDGHHLIEGFAVSYVPNLSSLLVRHANRDATAVLAVGTEEFALPEGSLAPLPGAAREVGKLRALYEKPSGTKLELLLNQSASVDRLRKLADNDEMANFRVLHFATHGEDVLTQAENPMETKLYLYDGVLDGLEIASWHLEAELVVLSACDSGKRASKGRFNQEDLAADEMFGLHAAFFNAGARNVIGALWPVDDETTCRIMVTLHRHLAKTTPEFALQAAMLEFLKDTDDAESNPAYWAPFFVTTVGR